MANVAELATRVLSATERGMQLPERAGVLAASTSVGRSFSRGLLPRATADQAIVTGVSVTLNYALTALAQSLIESAAFKVTGARPATRAERIAHRNVVLVGNVAAMGAGVLAQRVLAQRKDEPIVRAWGRTSSWRIAVGGLSGSILVGLDAAFDRLSGEGGRDWWRQVPMALPIGGALAAYEYQRPAQGDGAGRGRDRRVGPVPEGERVGVDRPRAARRHRCHGRHVRARGGGAAVRRRRRRRGACGLPGGRPDRQADRSPGRRRAAGRGRLRGAAEGVPQGRARRGRRRGRLPNATHLGVRQRRTAQLRLLGGRRPRGTPLRQHGADPGRDHRGPGRAGQGSHPGVRRPGVLGHHQRPRRPRHARAGGAGRLRAQADRVHVADRHRVPQLRHGRGAGVPDPR